MPITKLISSYSLTEGRLAQLRQVLPEAFADGKLNWETLREILGEHLEDEGEAERAERFGLFWPGKRQARRAAATPPQGTLAPAPGEGVREDTTRHVFIEGENLEVLKLLRKAYAGRVKMIYIDPPYNTGNDFVYPDDYAEPVEAYLRRTGQMGEGGELLSTNAKTGGRYHSNWLNMMYPRLVLARELLSSDGAVFVSIDDVELHNLLALMNEAMGGENAIAAMPWKGRGGRQDSAHVAGVHEYVVVYSKSAADFEAGGMPKGAESFPRIDPVTNRHYRVQLLRKWGSNSRREDRPNLYYPITAPDGAAVYPRLPEGGDGCWRWGPARMSTEMQAGNVEFADNHGQWEAYERIWEPAEGEVRTRKHSSWLDDVGNTASGTKELQELFGGATPFDYPKPTTLIRRLMQICSLEEDDVVLDFFAGSSSTGHAVCSENRDKGTDCRIVLVQIPEPLNPKSVGGEAAIRLGLGSIAEIGKERMRRVIARMEEESAGQLALEAREEPEDLGFRVYKLGRSQVKRWQPYRGESVQAVRDLFAQFESPLVEGWDPAALRVEIMLQEGFPLDSRVEPLAELASNHVDVIAHEWCEHRVFLCLDDALALETVERLPALLGEQDILVCLDSALSDEAKMRLDDRCNVHVI